MLNPWQTIKYQLYLLQLEGYELSRYFKLLSKKGLLPKGKFRKQLDWTEKAKLLFGVSLVLHIGLSFLVGLIFYWFTKNPLDVYLVSIIIFIILSLEYFILFPVALVIIYPLESYIRKKTVKAARQKLSDFRTLKIIGIAGSYGKTSMKNVLAVILAEKFEVAATPDSVNTPLGIAAFIQGNISEKTDVLIMEMGEHYEGDILELCDIAKPDIGMITGINESHLERLGSIETSIKTIFEISGGMKENGLLVLNADDELVRNNYEKYCETKKPEFYSYQGSELSEYKISDYNFSESKLLNNFEIKRGEKLVGSFEARILGEYILGTIMSAMIVARNLGLELEQIERGVMKLAPIKHRLEPIINPSGILVIDDSYNGNPAGVREAIKLLRKFKDKRRIYITPGLVEMGGKSPEIHERIGEQLAEAANLVILINNSSTPEIAKGLRRNGFSEKNITWFKTTEEAHAALGRILRSGDVILFQNDWGDQYL